MFKKKSVCVCSYSKYMENMKLGKKIDSYDKVVRINNGLNVLEPKSFGNKIDVFASSFLGGKIGFIERCYHALHKKKESIQNILIEKNVKDIIAINYGQTTLIDEIKKDYSDKFKICVAEDTLPKILFIITTGLATIIIVLKNKPKELFICGFDFTMYLHKAYENLYREHRAKFVGRLNKTYEEMGDDYHSTLFEKYLLKKLMLKYKFTVDDHLKKILDEINVDELDENIYTRRIKTEIFKEKFINYYNDIISIIDV